MHDDSPYVRLMQLCWVREEAERPSTVFHKEQIQDFEVKDQILFLQKHFLIMFILPGQSRKRKRFVF